MGLAAAAWSAVGALAIVAVLVLLGWLSGGMAEPMSDALRVAGLGWLSSLGASLAVPEGRYDLMPLGMTAVQVVLLYRSSRRATDLAAVAGGQQAAVLVLAGVVSFGAAAALVAAVSGEPLLHVEPSEAFAQALLLAGAAVPVGVLKAPERGPHLVARLNARLPEGPRRLVLEAVRPAAAALLVLIAASAGLVTWWLVARFPEITILVEGLDADVMGLLVLLVVSWLMLPTLIIWALAYLSGVGFAVGVGTSVRVDAVDLSTLPGFPLLGGLPQHPVGWGVVLLLLPLVAGLVGGVLAWRRAVDPDQPLVAWVRLAAATGLLAGLVSGLLASLAAGSAGPGLLGTVGPVPWQVAAATGVQVTVGAAAFLLGRQTWARRSVRALESEPAQDGVLER